jgi:hypothetical protein
LASSTSTLGLNEFTQDEYFNVEEYNNQNMAKIDAFASSVSPAGNPPINSQTYSRTPAPLTSTSGDATSMSATIDGWTGDKDMSIVNIKLASDIGAMATLNINNLGAVPIYKNSGEQPKAAEFKSGSILTLILNTSNNRFYVVGDGGADTVLPSGNMVYKGAKSAIIDLPTSGNSSGDYYLVGNDTISLYTGTEFKSLTIPSSVTLPAGNMIYKGKVDTLPTSGNNSGDCYLVGDNTIAIHNGTEFMQLSIPDIPSIYVQEEEPTNPKENDIWLW